LRIKYPYINLYQPSQSQSSFIVKFAEYIAGIELQLSEVKLKILKILWNVSDDFPKGWVKSSYLLGETGQKYFDRRTRELRDELGCDIEILHVDGEHCYRLKSPSLNAINPRRYLAPALKAKLFKDANSSCQICGKAVPPGIKGLQADHKIPLIRRGSHEYENWQAICNECNVVKRRACEGCNDDCYSCAWAFPEKFGGAIRLQLPADLYQNLKKMAGGDTVKMEKLIVNILAKNGKA
jgi:hypothetical protein